MPGLHPSAWSCMILWDWPSKYDVLTEHESKDTEWNHTLTYDGKLFLSRLKKDPDNFIILACTIGKLKEILYENVKIFFVQWKQKQIARDVE